MDKAPATNVWEVLNCSYLVILASSAASFTGYCRHHQYKNSRHHSRDNLGSEKRLASVNDCCCFLHSMTVVVFYT